MSKRVIIGCMVLGFLVSAQSVSAQYDYELAYGNSGRDSVYRGAVDMDDWLERGRAAVTESPVFPDGIRLTAWGREEVSEPGLASAIYYFTVPRWSQYMKITIQYRDAAQDDGIAGRLWIKSADQGSYGTMGAAEEVPLYGDTFILRAGGASETIIVPCSRHVEGNRVEMHIVAEGRDCLDVRDLRVSFLETRPGGMTIVHRTYCDYWHQRPHHQYAYHYYYWGPLFWPRSDVVYECWDVPHAFYWSTWRPWFYINIIYVHQHHPWWGPRRYTFVYHRDMSRPPVEKRHLLRKRLREHHVQVTNTIHSREVFTETTHKPARTHTPRSHDVQVQRQGNEVKKVNPAPLRIYNRDPQVQGEGQQERLVLNRQVRVQKHPEQHVLPAYTKRAEGPRDSAPRQIQEELSNPRAVKGTSRPRPGAHKRGVLR